MFLHELFWGYSGELQIHSSREKTLVLRRDELLLQQLELDVEDGSEQSEQLAEPVDSILESVSLAREVTRKSHEPHVRPLVASARSS